MSAFISLAAYRRYQSSSYSASPSSSSSPLQSIPEKVVPHLEGSAIDTDDETSQLASPVSSRSASSLSLAPSFDRESCISSVSSNSSYRPDFHFDISNHTLRRNEHLAVLLERNLWKSDSSALHCDIYHCHKSFSIIERKHHCRKCGGVFCRDCSSRTTPLLDTSKLNFIHPPRDTPITDFHSPISPVNMARVCDDCYEQLHGYSVPRSPRVQQSKLTAALKDSTAALNATLKQHKSTISSPLETDNSRPPLRRAQTTPSSPTISNKHRHLSSSGRTTPSSDAQSLAPISPKKEWDSLEDYPLREPSAVCRAKGGGRWEPVPQPMWDGYRPPYGKAPFEIVMEQEEEKQRLRKANPVIKDGVFQMRRPMPYEPFDNGKTIIYSTF